MVSALNSLTQVGIHSYQSSARQRNIRVTNYYCLVILVFTFILGSLLAIFYDGGTLAIFIIASGILCLTPLLLNYLEYVDASRFVLSGFVVINTLLVSIISKSMSSAYVEANNYFDLRFLLLAGSMIPLSTVNLSEKWLLPACLSWSFMGLTLLDVIHNSLGLGFYQLDQQSNTYYFSANFYSLSAYCFMVAGIVFLKYHNEKIEQKNEALIHQLNASNELLKQKHIEVESQNKEINAQSEELITNQDQLVEAYKTIEQQQLQLKKVNLLLKGELIERNRELTNANQELAKHNNELRQYSYTISHNLRGPVARVLGLSELLSTTVKEEEKQQYIQLILSSATELDGIISDLSKIIDLRDTLYHIREKVFFQDEWDSVQKALESHMGKGTLIRTSFEHAPFIYTIRPFLHSILYNLASNAMKYRSPQRILNIDIKAEKKGEVIELSVADNGLGINLKQFGKNIFGMYKRFHTHTEGKGIGLYLVKSQLDIIGGKIEVQSELNVGTTFTVQLPIPHNIEGQVCFSSDYGIIHYNARTNTIGVTWAQQVTPEAYRELFTKCAEMVRLYRAPFWISDVRKQGYVQDEDQIWMVTQILPEAVRFGLRRIAGIYDKDQYDPGYLERIVNKGQQLGVVINFFPSRQAAANWIEQGLSDRDAVP